MKKTNVQFKYYDYVFATLLLGYAFFVFCHIDIAITTSQIPAILSGHWLDFYDYFSDGDPNKAGGMQPNYMPSTYAILALWGYVPNLLQWTTTHPISHPILLWYKLGTLLCSFLALFYIKKTFDYLGLSTSKKITALSLLMTSPFWVYSLLIFSQMDIFGLLFIIIGMSAFVSNKSNYKNYYGSIFFGISMTFKYFGAFIYFPVLFLYEKSIPKIMLNVALFAIPYLAERVIFKDSIGFITGVLDYPLSNQLIFIPKFEADDNPITIHIYLFVFAMICAFSYFVQPKSDSEKGVWAFYLPLASLTFVYMLINWHPQWLIYMAPFMVISSIFSARAKTLSFFELVLYYFFLSYVTFHFKFNADQLLYENGALNHTFSMFELNGNNMYKFFPPYEKNWSYSIFSGLLFVSLILKFPIKLLTKNNLALKTEPEVIGIWDIRARLCVSVLLFAIPAATCLSRPSPYLHVGLLAIVPLIYLFLYLKRS